MSPDLKYAMGVLVATPLLPLMYFQGKQIRKMVPKLPEATGPEGVCTADTTTKETLRLLVIGESTMAGVGVATHREGFAGTLADEIARRQGMNVRWQVYAKSGYTVRQIRKRLLPRTEGKVANLIVLGIGGNDAFTLNSLRSWREEVNTLIDELRTQFVNTPIVFANMPPIRSFPAFTGPIQFVLGNLVEIFGEALAQISRNTDGVYYHGRVITTQDWKDRLLIEAPNSAFFSDGVHPSKLAYQTWARDLAQFIDHQVGAIRIDTSVV